MNKFLDFLVLEPVTEFKPCIKIKVSRKVQTLVRIVSDLIIMFACSWFMKDEEIGLILLKTVSILVMSELFLKGIHLLSASIDWKSLYVISIIRTAAKKRNLLKERHR